ncbi:MAG TPA: pseudouridine synthase [Marinagarivorans sp.]
MAALDVVLEHRDFVVINKPAGIAVHGHEDITLLDQVREGFGRCDMHPVHRLDLATSGLVIFAKTPSANSTFCRAFAARAIDKLYLALSASKANKKRGWVKGDMAKARGGSYKLLRSQRQPATTYAISSGAPNQPRLWWLRPTTGKTHQLRVALKSLGAPILGDRRYGGASADRLYLHAWGLRFSYQNNVFDLHAAPTSGRFFTDIMQSGRLDQAGDPWLLDWPSSFAAALPPAITFEQLDDI